MCGVGRTVFVVSSNVGIHHWLDRLFLEFAVLVEVIVIHIEGTVTFEAEAEPLGEHHSLGVFELVIGIPQTGVKPVRIERIYEAVSFAARSLSSTESFGCFCILRGLCL